MGEQLTYLGIFVLCIILSAYFSASETAFTSASSIRLNAAKEKGDTKAATALSLLQQFQSLLSTILIGNNFVNILSSSVATLFFVNITPRYGATLSTIITTALLLMFGEITPKLIARISPEKYAKASAPILKFMMFLLRPVIWLADQWQKLVVRFVDADQPAGISEEELKTYVDEARKSGGIEGDEHRLVHAAIEFDDIDVRMILTPRVDVVGFDILKATDREIEELFNRHSYSRLLVYEDQIDQVVGILEERDFNRYLIVKERNNIQNYPLENMLTEVLFVPPVINLSDLLALMQKNTTHLAVVVDEYGGTKGIVTLEDIIEVLVGDIWDEGEEPLPFYEEIDPDQGKYKISGRMSIEQFFKLFNIEPNQFYASNTVSGFIIEHLEYVPQDGEVLQLDKYEFTIVKADKHIITEIISQQIAD